MRETRALEPSTETASGPHDALWVAGLALLVLEVGRLGIGRQGEDYEWSQYLLLGTVFPTLLLAVGLLRKPPARAIRLGLAGFGTFVALRYVVAQGSWPVLAMAAIHTALLLSIPSVRFEGGRVDVSLRTWPTPGEVRRGLVRAASFGLIVMMTWVATAQLVWAPTLGERVADSSGQLTLFVASFSLVAWSIGGKSTGVSRGRAWWVGTAAAVVVLALASVRIDDLGHAPMGHAFWKRGQVAYHHWGAIVGSVELVRQGGWPLWDVPIQYGFLSTLAVAWAPVEGTWQSLYVVNSTLMFLSALFLFGLLRTSRGGVGNLTFALLVTLAAVFLVPGQLPATMKHHAPMTPGGSQTLPAIGAFRFIWCHVLLGVLVLVMRAEPGGVSERRRLVLGCWAWLLATFWSSESAVYAVATWLPAFALLAARRAWAVESGWRRRAAHIARWLALPPAMLATAVAAVTIFYRARLGHAPDWTAMVEYSLATRFFAMPIDRTGVVWALFAVFCGLSAVAAYILARGRSLGALAVLCGAWGALWATSSYFISRSHDVNAVNLSPIAAVGIALGLRLLRHEKADGATSIRAGFVPILTVYLMIGFGDRAELGRWANALRRGYVRDVDRLLPVVDPSLALVLDGAKVRPGEPLIYAGEAPWNPLPVRPIVREEGGVRHTSIRWRNRAWLPAITPCLFVPLPDERRNLYLERFLARTEASGWLAQPKALDGRVFVPLPRIGEILGRTHVPTRIVEDGRWKLTYYERKEAVAARDRGLVR